MSSFDIRVYGFENKGKRNESIMVGVKTWEHQFRQWVIYHEALERAIINLVEINLDSKNKRQKTRKD